MMKEVDRCYRQIFWSEEVGELWKMRRNDSVKKSMIESVTTESVATESMVR